MPHFRAGAVCLPGGMEATSGQTMMPAVTAAANDAGPGTMSCGSDDEPVNLMDPVEPLQRHIGFGPMTVSTGGKKTHPAEAAAPTAATAWVSCVIAFESQSASFQSDAFVSHGSS